jgi:hypothetical protein
MTKMGKTGKPFGFNRTEKFYQGHPCYLEIAIMQVA